METNTSNTSNTAPESSTGPNSSWEDGSEVQPASKYEQPQFKSLDNTFNINSIDSLRGVTAAEAAAAKGDLQGSEAHKAALEAHFNAIRSYLDAAGIDKKFHDYDSVLSRVDKILNIPDDEWKSDDGEFNPQSKSKVLTAREDEYARTKFDDEVTDPEAENFQELEARVDDLRGQLASLSAKRQSRLRTGRNGKNTYAELKEEYNEAVRELGKAKLAEQLEDDSLTDTERNTLVVQYLFDEQDCLRKASAEKIKNTKVGRVVDFMTRGNFAVRTLKGIAVGAGAAVIGTGLGAVVAGAGVIGAGVAATAALTATARFARGFAVKDGAAGRGISELSDAEKMTVHHDIGQELSNKAADEQSPVTKFLESTKDKDDLKDFFDIAQSKIDARHEVEIKREQAKRRRSVGAGVVSMVLGAGIGAAAGLVADNMIFGGDLNRTITPTVGAEPVDGGAPDGGATDGGGDSGKELPINNDDIEQHVSNINQTPEAPVYDPNFNVGYGEGGISLFQGIGLTEANWYEVSGELLNNFPAEFYADGGDVRIANPGQLSIEAQEFIKTRFGL